MSNCNGNCAKCNEEHDKDLKEALEQPFEDVIFKIKADVEARLTEEGIQFSQGTSAITMGEIPNTKENRARVALGWNHMVIAMDHPRESEQSFEPTFDKDGNSISKEEKK